MSIFKKLYYAGLWLLSNKLAMAGGDALIVDLPTKVPDYEYEVLARSFLPYILEYFSKEENVKDFEDWKARRKLKNEQRVQA
ncbi:MAG: hypothetical protein IKJ04_09120 [Clostridia bacterium]|nr:hypothetical protein [Clostridia bacterium]